MNKAKYFKCSVYPQRINQVATKQVSKREQDRKSKRKFETRAP